MTRRGLKSSIHLARRKMQLGLTSSIQKLALRKLNIQKMDLK